MSTGPAQVWMRELYTEELYLFSCDTIVVLPRPWKDLEREEVVLLENILKAIKVGLPGVQVVHERHLTTGRLLQLNPRYAIVFGSTLEDPLPYGEIAVFGNTRLVRAAGLGEMDDGSKQVLWSALKKMYGL